MVFIAVFPDWLFGEVAAPHLDLHQVDRSPMHSMSQAACHALCHRPLRGAHRPPCPAISPGTTIFVSGMYRNDWRRHAAIIECPEAIPEKTDECGLQRALERGCERVFHA